MVHFDEGPLDDLEAQPHRNDPRPARVQTGRPRRPREYRQGPAWLLLAFSLAALTTGLALGRGLLIAAGIVLAGAAGHLFDRRQALTRRRAHTRRP